MFALMLVVAIVVIALGVLEFLAAAMSDNPGLGDSEAKQAVIWIGLAIAMIILAFVLRHYSVI